MTPETKYKGSIKLSAIGDALGWITEFEKSKENLTTKYNKDYVDSFHNWSKNVGGRFHGYVDNINAGSYSDDTQLLLSVARSINEEGFINHEYFSKIELPNWLLYSRGAGRTIKNAARKIERKSAQWNNNFFTFKAGKNTIDYRDSGANGAAMRILPIALANFGDINKINEEIFANSIVTHGHPRALLGAMLYGYAIDTILRFNPDNFNFNSFITELGKDIHKKFSLSFLSKEKYFSWEKEWNKKSKHSFKESFKTILDETQDYLRLTYKMLSSEISDFDALSKLGCYKSETKGSGTSTVIAGIYLTCKYYKQPLKSVEQAVNSLGTDSDSIAAFAGGLIGALCGQSIIPTRWEKVQDFDYLDKVAIRLLEISEGSASKNEIFSNEKQLKELNNVQTDNYNVGENIFFNPLGIGKIMNIDRQRTLAKGQYNLLLNVNFEIGQSCLFAFLLKDSADKEEILAAKDKIDLEVDFLNSFNIDFRSKEKIDNFKMKLSYEQQIEFVEILRIITNKRNK